MFGSMNVCKHFTCEWVSYVSMRAFHIMWMWVFSTMNECVTFHMCLCFICVCVRTVWIISFTAPHCFHSYFIVTSSTVKTRAELNSRHQCHRSSDLPQPTEALRVRNHHRPIKNNRHYGHINLLNCHVHQGVYFSPTSASKAKIKRCSVAFQTKCVLNFQMEFSTEACLFF